MKPLIILFLFVVMTSCTKQHVIDTGITSPTFNGNMMEYLRSDNYNWQLTVELIEHAGLTELFEGKDQDHPEITFLGFTSHSVQRYLFDSQYLDSSEGSYRAVTDIPVTKARELVLRHVVHGNFLKNHFEFKQSHLEIDDPQQAGGTLLATLHGNTVRAFREKTPWEGIPDAGPVLMRLFSLTRSRVIPVASPDIRPSNGVVHALNYSYEFPII